MFSKLSNLYKWEGWFNPERVDHQGMWNSLFAVVVLSPELVVCSHRVSPSPVRAQRAPISARALTPQALPQSRDRARTRGAAGREGPGRPSPPCRGAAGPLPGGSASPAAPASLCFSQHLPRLPPPPGQGLSQLPGPPARLLCPEWASGAAARAGRHGRDNTDGKAGIAGQDRRDSTDGTGGRPAPGERLRARGSSGGRRRGVPRAGGTGSAAAAGMEPPWAAWRWGLCGAGLQRCAAPLGWAFQPALPAGTSGVRAGKSRGGGGAQVGEPRAPQGCSAAPA